MQTNIHIEKHSSFTRICVTKLDDFLNDLAEELAPSREFIAKANKMMDEIFRKLQVRQMQDL